MSDRHDWNGWDDYLAAHDRWIQNFEHFIIDDQLIPTLTQTQVSWKGVLYCMDGLEISVRKKQQVQYVGGRRMVRTIEYKYHALRREGVRTINLFRYDNIHMQPGHPDPHHRHRYDASGNEIEPPQHVGEDHWPTLGEVIDELHQWWVSWRATRQP